MFDVAFSEMVLVAVVALIVIGPERLPKAARTIGHLIGRMNRYVNDVKADINREMEVDELRKFKEEFQDAAQSIEQTIHKEFESAEGELANVEASLSQKNGSVPSQELTQNYSVSDQGVSGSDGIPAPSQDLNSAASTQESSNERRSA